MSEEMEEWVSEEVRKWVSEEVREKEEGIM